VFAVGSEKCRQIDVREGKIEFFEVGFFVEQKLVFFP
jgi:hypothetical protein